MSFLTIFFPYKECVMLNIRNDEREVCLEGLRTI